MQAYLPLDDEQKLQFEGLLQSGTYVEVRAMNQTVYEKGIEKGRQEGQVELVASLIEERFGPIPEGVRQELKRLPLQDLRRLALRIGTAASLADLGLAAS